MMDRRLEDGARGEAIAAEMLERAGMRVVARNVRYRVGELDIIAEDEGTLVFVEVRSRWRRNGPRAEDTVTFGKQRRLSKAALLFWRIYGGPCRRARFDVIAVDLARGQVAAHHRAAFELREGG
jgi:putative endonuclease